MKIMALSGNWIGWLDISLLYNSTSFSFLSPLSFVFKMFFLKERIIGLRGMEGLVFFFILLQDVKPINVKFCNIYFYVIILYKVIYTSQKIHLRNSDQLRIELTIFSAPVYNNSRNIWFHNHTDLLSRYSDNQNLRMSYRKPTSKQ